VIEKHLLSTYVRYKTEQSKIVPGAVYSKPVFRCPACHASRDVPEHGVPFTCECGLRMTATGNVLTLESDT